MAEPVENKIMVSVIIPVYNREKYIEKAVKSAVLLDGVGEVILVDDGSTDSSLEICLSFEKKFPGIRVLRHPNGINKGVSATRNLGVANSKMPYVAFLDSDDWYEPWRFKKDAEIFNKYSNVDVCFSNTILESNYNSKRLYGLKKNFDPQLKVKEIYQILLMEKGPFTDTNGITIKKTFLDRFKWFDERLKLHEDTELWLRLLRKGRFYHAENKKPVAVIRKHDDNTITNRNVNSQKRMLAVFFDNVGVENLYDFEKKHFLKKVLRRLSEKYKTNSRRRFFYYNYLIYASIFPNKFLKKFTQDFFNG